MRGHHLGWQHRSLAYLLDMSVHPWSSHGTHGIEAYADTTWCALQTLKERKDAPSNFTLKLRKHIRTRRLEDVRQLGVVRDAK
jgi:hypothetical protein